MIRILGLISIVLMAHNALAASIQGKVTVDGIAQEFVTIRLLGKNLGDRTASDGTFEIKNIAAGTYKLVASGFGLQNDTTDLTLTENENRILNISMQKIVQELEEVTITTTMREVSVSDSPIAIDIITPRLFEKNPSPGLFESIGMVNGVRPQLQCNVCNTGDIHINGMEGPYTMVMIDGMPIVSALGSVYGLMGIPNAIIQRIEVQKGPSSTLYGSEAVGGLINVITRSADCGPKITADVFGTSYEEFNAELSGVYKLGKRVTGIMSGSYFHFDRIWDINHDNFTDVTLQKRAALFNKFTFTHGSGKMSHLAFRYYYETRWGGELKWTPEFHGSDSIYGENIYTNRLEIIGKSPLKFGGQEFELQYSFNKHVQHSAYGQTVFNADQNIGFAQLIKHIKFERQNLLIGAALRYTYYDDNTLITISDDTLNPENKPLSTYLPGIFVQDEISVNEKNMLLIGLRFDYNTDHGSILSPRFNWKYEANQNNIIRLGFGNGYRVVNLFSEDHAAYTGAREVVIRQHLKPEQSWSGNLNYSGKRRFKKLGAIGIDANLFYTYFSNKIVADYFTDANQVIFDNLSGYGINRGAGAQIHWTIANPVKLTIGATYTDLFLMNKDKFGGLYRSEQVHTPPLTANFVLSYTIAKAQLSIDLSGNLYSPMLLPVLPDDYRSAYSPWFSILNIRVMKTIKYRWEIYGGVKNFLNFVPQEDAIMRPFDPFDKYIDDPVTNPNGYTFDPGYNYAPIQKARMFLGVRYRM
ncbi:MAG: TonB-dependent receptor [Bacteroidetes bacterium]|nr:MAG: TonB-dependent receptor [Bacteroidota bacterium]